MTAKVVDLVIKWPPSVNHYWLQRGKKKFLSSDARVFREAVRGEVLTKLGWQFEPLESNLCLELMAYAPDKRRRDLDNIFKAILDSLQQAKVFKDDNQIKKIFAHMFYDDERKGRVVVRISEIEKNE